MKKIAGLVTVVFLVSALHIHAQDRALRVVATENLGPQVNIGKQYALFIAIDAYRYWNPLKKPVADAREIRDILRQDYYIDEVIELYNQDATRANIARTFTDLQSKLGVHDSLFIYYAGHGHLDESSNAGFWIPVDGGTDQFAQENWLPNSQIRGYISRFKAIHVFMVNDSCFSGDILNTNRSMPPQIDNAFLRRAYALTSRQVITSGASEEVPDQSEVSAALINSLRKNTSPLLAPDNIYDDVKLSVRKTLPLLGNLEQSGHQNGATFLFFRRSSAPEPNPVVTTQTYKIGDRGPAGGIVFFDKGEYSDGWRYMEVAPTDFPNEVYWSQNGGLSFYPSGGGRQVTEFIVAELKNKGETGMAAQLCASYNLNGYTDWFLPSMDDLGLMDRNLHQKGLGNFIDTYYWSSWPSSPYSAEVHNFANGSSREHSGTARVRAVRAF